MSQLDCHVDKKLVGSPRGDRNRRSEAEYRLYWATYRRATAPEALRPHKKRHVRKGLSQLLAFLRGRRQERVPPEMRVGEDESHSHPLGSET
jgi:hypothetical protein